MSFGNDKFLFLHVPRAGGTWAMTAMKAAGVSFTPEREDKHHLLLRECDVGDRFTFGFVREPLSWYGSQYNYRRDARWDDEGFPGDPWLDLPFPAFVERMTEHYPGHLSWVYQDFLGEQGDVDFIGRFENLTEDLVTALHMAEVDFDEQLLRGWPATNKSAPTPFCPEDLRVRLMRSEIRTYKRFYPEEIVALTAGPVA